jgi:hypothetical protein
MEVGETAVVRFLPDKDQDNQTKFLSENLTHELMINGKKKIVPCLHMYGESCPICELSQKFYAQNDEIMGKKYYKKRSYIGQVLVLDSPFDYLDPEEENPSMVRLIDFGPAVFKCVQTAYKSGDLDEEPFMMKGGYDFRIRKTKDGKWAGYSTSSFSPKQTDIDDDVIELIMPELKVLSEFREKYVSRAALEALLIADQTGSDYENGNGSDNEGAGETTSTPSKQVGDESTTRNAEVQTESSSVSTKGLSVLEQLKARAAAKQNAS